jgi:hypothetical protein
MADRNSKKKQRSPDEKAERRSRRALLGTTSTLASGTTDNAASSPRVVELPDLPEDRESSNKSSVKPRKLEPSFAQRTSRVPQKVNTLALTSDIAGQGQPLGSSTVLSATSLGGVGSTGLPEGSHEKVAEGASQKSRALATVLPRKPSAWEKLQARVHTLLAKSNSSQSADDTEKWTQELQGLGFDINGNSLPVLQEFPEDQQKKEQKDNEKGAKVFPEVLGAADKKAGDRGCSLNLMCRQNRGFDRQRIQKVLVVGAQTRLQITTFRQISASAAWIVGMLIRWPVKILNPRKNEKRKEKIKTKSRFFETFQCQ